MDLAATVDPLPARIAAVEPIRVAAGEAVLGSQGLSDTMEAARPASVRYWRELDVEADAEVRVWRLDASVGVDQASVDDADAALQSSLAGLTVAEIIGLQDALDVKATSAALGAESTARADAPACRSWGGSTPPKLTRSLVRGRIGT